MNLSRYPSKNCIKSNIPKLLKITPKNERSLIFFLQSTFIKTEQQYINPKIALLFLQNIPYLTWTPPSTHPRIDTETIPVITQEIFLVICPGVFSRITLRDSFISSSMHSFKNSYKNPSWDFFCYSFRFFFSTYSFRNSCNYSSKGSFRWFSSVNAGVVKGLPLQGFF